MKRCFAFLPGILLSAVMLTGCEEAATGHSSGSGSVQSESRASGIISSAAAGAVQARNRGKEINYEMELKQLGMGMTMYISEHGDCLPGALDELAAYCSGIDLSSYVYIGDIGRVPGNSSSVPVAFVKPQLCSGNTLPVLMADGHVKKVTVSRLSSKTVRQITGELIRNISDSPLKSKLLNNAGK